MLNTKSLALAGGAMGGLVMLVLTLISVTTGYAASFLGSLSSVYVGYTVTYIGSLVGLIYGFIDGFIGLYLIGWFYNYFEGK